MSAPAPAADPAGTVRNPFVGPRAYGRDDRLYGRDGETEDLLDLIVAERVVLLYSPSGAGKTSLVEARLVPRLESDGFRVLPTVSTKHEVPAAAPTEGPTPNRYVLSTLLSLEEGLPAPKQRPIAELAGLTIARYLAEAPRQADAPENAVLIFDQFEEVLTTRPADRPAKREFFTQVGSALRDRSMWALFVIREDFVAELDPYARLIPTRFANRYRLDLLEEPAALDAVTLSSRDSGVTFHPDAAKKLVDDLRRIRVQHLGTVSEEKGPYVEPVQLQVVCRQLWERLAPGVRTIEEADVEGVGDVNQALATYYAESMAATAETAGTDEAVLREWVDRELITAQGFRAQTLYGPHHDPSRDDAVLGALIDRHLLRSEPRRGAVWYELAHDRLVEPIQKDNALWRDEHLSELEQRAALWDVQGRGDDLLVTGPALIEAEAALRHQGNQPSARMHDFLETSRRRQQDAERMQRARKQSQRSRVIAVAAFVLALLASSLVVVQRQGAHAMRDRADFVLQVTRASAVAAFDPDLGLALAVRAADLPGGAAAEIAEWIQPLLDTNRVVLPLPAEGPTPRAVAFSDDAQFMVTGNEAGTLRVYDRNGALKATLEAGDGLRSVGFGPSGTDGPAVVAGSAGHVSVWASPADTDPRIIPSSSSAPYAVALSPDGQRVAFGTEDGSVVLANAVAGDPIVPMRRLGAPDTASVVDVGWTPDGTRVAAIDTDGHVVLWDSATATPLWDIAAHTRGKALDVSSNTDKQTIATAGDERAKTWDLATGEEQNSYRMWGGPAWDVDLSRDGERLLVVGYNGSILSYNTADRYDFSYPDFGTRRIAAALDPNNNDRALVASLDSSAAVMDVSRGHSQDVIALDVTPDGTVLTAAGDDGTLRRWSKDGLLEEEQDTGDTGITDIALSTNGRTVAILYESEVNSEDGSEQAIVRVLRVGENPDPNPVVDLLRGDRITAIAITGDGRFVATAEDGAHAITITDTTGQVAPRRLVAREARITGLDFGGSPDKLAAVYADNTLQWWNSGSEPATRPLHGNQQFGPAYTVEWSPNGELIATAGGGKVPEVWGARTDERFTLDSHTQPVYDIAFADDGRIATVGADREVVIWDVTGDQPKPQSRRNFSSWGTEVAFSPNGSRVYIAGARGAPYVVYLNDEELRTVAQDRLARLISREECRRYVAPAESCPGG